MSNTASSNRRAAPALPFTLVAAEGCMEASFCRNLLASSGSDVKSFSMKKVLSRKSSPLLFFVFFFSSMVPHWLIAALPCFFSRLRAAFEIRGLVLRNEVFGVLCDISLYRLVSCSTCAPSSNSLVPATKRQDPLSCAILICRLIFFIASKAALLTLFDASLVRPLSTCDTTPNFLPPPVANASNIVSFGRKLDTLRRNSSRFLAASRQYIILSAPEDFLSKKSFRSIPRNSG
mmetsp:Transcript_27310/g.41319  ORF Transcript_27310/g.41319 Transcript_27310/m.41319 type:complete len:233 (-) Transcript_27310:1515-2213(-)